ncbi:MAG: sodium:solute symporter family protein [Candidatus Riflemargulisbacteria bacterium]
MIDQIIVITYLTLILLIGIIAGRKGNDMETFSVAGRNMPFFFVFATIAATFIYQDTTIGNAEKVFLFGIYNIFALFGFSLKEILIAKFIAPQMMYHSDCLTVGDIMGKHYGKLAKILTGLLSVIVSTLILSVQITVIGYLFNIFFDIDILYGVLFGTGLIVLYSTIGGLKSIMYTHLLQFIMIIISIPLIIYFGVVELAGWGNIVSVIPTKNFDLFGNISVIAFISLFLSFMLGDALLPPYVQRLFSSDDPKTVSRAVLLNGFFSLIIFITTGIIGFVAYALFPSTEANEAIPMIIMTLLPIGIKGIVITGILSITLSSADSFLNSAAVSTTNDILKPIFFESEKIGSIWTARIFTVLIGIIAAALALFINNIVDVLLYSYILWTPILLVPLIFAILKIKSSKKQFYQSALAGIIGVSLWSYTLQNPFEINGLLIGFLASLITFMTLNLTDKKTSPT